MKLTGRVFGKLRQLRRSSKGGAALELAVVFPIILLLLVGVVDYGRMYFTSVTVANAARAGAEYGAYDPQKNGVNTAEMQNFAKRDGGEAAGTLRVVARQYCECAGVGSTCASFCPGGAAPEVYDEAIATDTLSTLFNYPGLPQKITIVRKATFRSQ